MDFRSAGAYARELKPSLPADFFAPARIRLAWLPLHLSVIAIAITSLGAGWVPLYLAPLVSLVIGVSFGGLTFLAHETLHGAVVRGKLARHVVGWLGFLPFTVSPRLWMAWHNQVHHNHSNEPGEDPDANPTLAEYQATPGVRTITDHFTLGRGSLTGFIGLLVGFTGQSTQVLGYAGRRGYLSKRQHRLAMLETGLGVAVWLTVLALVGPLAFLFAFVIPLLIANAIVMAFIFTNHGLSPITRTNDPLAGSLSVTTPRIVEWLTLGFGFHVEHHLYPGVSSSKGPLLRSMLVARWPERYQSMPLWRALLAMQHTGRVYKTDTVLCDPRTGREWPVLGEMAVKRVEPAAEPAAERRAGKLAIDMVQSG